MNELRRLLRYAKPYRGRLIAALGGMVLYALGQLGIIYQVQPIFNDVLKLQTLASANSNVAKVGLMIVAFYVLKGIGAYVSGYLMSDVGQRVVRDVRNQLFRHTLGQSAAFFARRSSGTLLSRLTNDVSQVQTAVSETLADLTRESIAVVVIVVYLFVTDWRLALVFLTSAPLIVYPLTQLGQRVRRTTRRGQEELEHLTHLASEAFSGHRIVKAFGAEEREARRFANSAEGLYRTYMRIISAVSVLPPLMELIGGIAAVAALWYGALQIADGKLTPGEFSSFLVAGFTMYGPIKKLSRVNASIQQTIAASERIFETLDTHTEVRELVDAPVLPRLRRGVQFKMVGFSYEDRADKFVLREIDLDVAAGQVVALVGLSGAGKTSLVNLLPRFYDVTEGAVLIDGIDIRTVSLKSLRDQIALVTQETVLFDDTIAANIAYGVPQASPGAIEAAARAAHAHEFISLLPNGYSARIGERGQRLSGGQRQRLAIARALLKDSPLLILDEATSSLDAESELLVQDALTNLMRNRTTFVIAHRLSTVRRADLIVALEGGRVMEIGTHDELLGNPDGVYAKLYALQTFDEKDRSGAAADTVDSTDGQEEKYSVIRSMTGFASVNHEVGADKVHVTIKSVNHRFLDVVFKAPQALAPIESKMRTLVQQRLVRGRVEVTLGLDVTTPPEREVVLDVALIDRLAKALDDARERGVITGTLTASDVVRIPQVVEIRTRHTEGVPAVAESAAALVERTLLEALDALIVMRETEGRFIAADLEARVATLSTFVDQFEREAREGQAGLEARLRARLAELPTELQGDPVAMGQEVVRFVSRSDVDEELSRMRGHVDHWRALSNGPEACGRKLDFLVQEMNREINTMGSKVEGSRGPEMVIAAKAELERVREQVQNVE